MSRKEFLYANSLYHLNERLVHKIANGWQVVGEIRQQENGKFGCMVMKEIPFGGR